MDHKSPARFSTGVPVSANRAWALSSFTARAWRVPAFLIAWASSKITTFHARCRKPSIRASIP